MWRFSSFPIFKEKLLVTCQTWLLLQLLANYSRLHVAIFLLVTDLNSNISWTIKRLWWSKLQTLRNLLKIFPKYFPYNRHLFFKFLLVMLISQTLRNIPHLNLCRRFRVPIIEFNLMSPSTLMDWRCLLLLSIIPFFQRLHMHPFLCLWHGYYRLVPW